MCILDIADVKCKGRKVGFDVHIKVERPWLAHSVGALDGGVPMSHVDFQNWQCRMSLSLINAYVPCRI